MLVLSSRIGIPKASVNNLYNALKSATNISSHQECHVVDFIDRHQLGQANDALSLLESCRWIPETDNEGNITELNCAGEKLGDEDCLFATIAPYVKSGSYIIVALDNGALWRWLFEDGAVVKQIGRPVFDGHESGVG
jgi:hypothetical protein